jgi:hypothetical protein
VNEHERQDDAALDRLLAQARWDEPTAADEYRLREDWMHLRRRRRIAPVLYLATAAAVVVMVAGTLSVMRPAPEKVVQRNEKPPVMLVTQGDEPPASLIPSRPATAYERLIAMQSGGSAPVGTVPQPAVRLDSGMQKLVDQLGDPLVNRRYEAARELARSGEPQVVPVLQEMVQEGVNRREALAALLLSDDPSAARALSEVRTSRTIDAQVIALSIELQ